MSRLYRTAAAALVGLGALWAPNEAEGVQLAPPCLSDFQSVEIPAPAAGWHFPAAVRVSGEHALVTARVAPTGETDLLAFHLDAATGIWSFRQTLRVDGALVGGDTMALAGTTAAIGVARKGSAGVAVLHYQEDAQLWVEMHHVALSGQLRRVSLAKGTLAASTEFFRDEIHVLQLRGAAPPLLEATLSSTDPSQFGFAEAFCLVPGHLISSHLWRLDVFDRNGAGSWSHAATLNTNSDLGWSSFWPKVVADGRRVLMQGSDGQGGSQGYGSWRWNKGLAGYSLAYDGGVFESDTPSPFRSVHLAFAEGTALVDLEGPGCGGSDPARRAIAVLEVGAGDAWEMSGQFCGLAGFTSTERVRSLDYDGRNVAAVAVAAIGQPLNTMQFASLLGADLDRDRNCVEDADEIAQQPALDRNVNGVLDAYEERGASECAPTGANSTGAPGALRLIGSEFAGSRDMVAVGSELPRNAVCLLAVAVSPGAGVPTGSLGLCIGAGSGSTAIGLYPTTRADANGIATVGVVPTQLPIPGGVIEAFAGETWGWQLAYRDGPQVRLTNAIRLLLE